jgi:DNA polymerase-4
VSALRDASRAAAIDALRDRFGAAAVQSRIDLLPESKDCKP